MRNVKSQHCYSKRKCSYEMSLVVLKSLEGGDASQFDATYDEPIILHQESEVQLVNAIFEDDEKIIIDSDNNQCLFQFGTSAGSSRTATLTPGTYEVNSFQVEFERALNAAIETQGCSIIVTKSLDTDGMFHGYRIRFEYAFNPAAGVFPDGSRGAHCTSATANSATTLTCNGTADAWSDMWASSPNAISRGKGYTRAKVPDVSKTFAWGVSTTALVDGGDDTQLYLGVSFDGGNLSVVNQGVITAVDAGVWAPANNDFYQVYKTGNTLVLQAATSAGGPWTDLASITQPAVFCFPAFVSYTQNTVLSDIKYVPDGSKNPASTGMLADDDPSWESALHENVDAERKSRKGAKIIFIPDKMQDLLGFRDSYNISGGGGGIEMNTWITGNDTSMNTREDQPALVVSLPQLPIRSRNTGTGLTSGILAILPRLQRTKTNQLVYEPSFPLPVKLDYLQPTPVNTIRVEIKTTDGARANLRGVSVVTLWIS